MATGKNIATIFLTMALVSLVGGILKLKYFSFYHFLFCVFFILFRIKMFMDDLIFCEKYNYMKLSRKISFIFGIFSWFLWVVAAVTIDNFNYALSKIIFAFILSTVCIVIVIFTDYEKRHKFWLCTNLIYISIITCAIFQILPYGMSMLILIIICLIDMNKSESLKALEI
jgi:hypothetical protein